MSEHQKASVQVIRKIDHWIEFLNIMRQIAQEEASNESLDTFISDKMQELINKVSDAWKEDETMQSTTFQFEHKTGCEVSFGLTCGLAKTLNEEQ